MKLGCCASIDKADIVHAVGFNFIECTVVSLKPEESDEQFKSILKEFEESPVPVEAYNIFLPGDMKVVGDAVDYPRIDRYVMKALERVKLTGADTVVFGSGRARQVPEGFSRDRAEEQILEFLNLVADYADPLGITIVIEPLNRKESNIINSVPEAVKIARAVNRKSISVLADFYHMDEEQEPLEHVFLHQDLLKHIHVADTGRLAPGTGHYPYHEFVDHVKRSRYGGRISIECKWNDFEQEARQAYQFLQKQFNNDGV